MLQGTLIYGFVNSVILALLALGFNLTFGISGVANFAYGALYILAAYTAWMLLTWLKIPLLISIILAVLFTSFIGGLIYRFIVLVWAFIGIAVKQTSAPNVVLSAWIAASLMFVLAVYSLRYHRAV